MAHPFSTLLRLVNATPHAVAFYDERDVDASNPHRLVVSPGAEPYLTLPPSGMVLNARRAEGDLTFREFGNGDATIGVPMRRDTFPAVDTPPDPNAAYVVSLLYASAAREAGVDAQLFTVTGAVYASPDAKTPCGCLALSPTE